MLALCVDDERLGLEALKRTVSLAPQVTGTAAFDNENDDNLVTDEDDIH